MTIFDVGGGGGDGGELFEAFCERRPRALVSPRRYQLQVPGTARELNW
eukprot:CAMPEP_0194728136 /NCGR_PEP_ID=MMETSP0296-20130528/38035_1 /TAXON_ID=39354 /ORGANISM="Heterosigma akashiwo, Strain CCMP2393" /LENGTH=47 /DNA_ID= /DNA_START= /DNA_END= /DNA_ORIENTATION=